MTINARQVNILRANTAGVHTTLDQYLSRKRIIQMPWNEAQVISVSNAQSKLIDSTTHLPSGRLAVLVASPPTTITTNAGICAAELSTAVGTAAVTAYTDNHGNILNLVQLRDATTHEEIVVLVSSVNRTVYGLVQCANSVTEGTNIGAAASENTQISFIYLASDGTVTLTAITGSIEFTINKAFIESQEPDVLMIGGRQEELLVEAQAIMPLVSKHVITAAFASGEVMTIATGAGSSGTSTVTKIPSAATITIGAAETDFNDNNAYRVRLNGMQLIRNVEVEWESATTISINQIMDIGDVLEIEIPA